MREEPMQDRDGARLHGYLAQSPALYGLLTAMEGFPFPYYVGAGAIAQTVWNVRLGLPPLYGIGDVDIVYFDPDTSYQAEDQCIRSLKQRLTAFPLPLDIKNQARVHLWYESRFHKEIPPYPSLEAAISTWPTTATAIGVRLDGGDLCVHAPFGLGDLLAGVIRPNKALITEEVYRQKAEKWHKKWPSLTIVPW